MSDLKNSLNFHEESIDKKLDELQKSRDNVLSTIKEKFRTFEDRNGRNNLRIDRLQENANESWKDVEEKVQVFFATEWMYETYI